MIDAWVLPGKTGDVISVLPILHEEFRLTGEPQNLVVSRQYSSVLQAALYVNAIIWDGDWQDLAVALKMAKKNFGSVVNLATYGTGFPVEHKTPSYEYDRWLRAGYLDKWDELPMVVDVGTTSGHDGAILVADKGSGVLFQHSRELVELIEKSFPDKEVVRLSELKLPNFCGFVYLYDRAAALVTIDTAHLHLSKASKVPKFVFATDAPSYWSGSGWSRHFKFYARYSEWNDRKYELIDALRNELVNKAERPEIEKLPMPGLAYNPTISMNGDNKLITASRYHPDKAQWRTQLNIREEGEFAVPVAMPDKVAMHTAEDPKLFHHQNKLHISYVVGMYPGGGNCGFTPCVVGYGPLVKEDGKWRVEQHNQIKYAGNDFTSQVKNLVFISHGGKLYCVYQVSPEQIVFEVEGDKIMQIWRTKTPEWAYGQMKGGSNPLMYQDQWLRFFHSRTGKARAARDFRYHIGALLMDSQPPFQVTAVSKEPILSGDEEYIPGHKFWKPNVVFAGTVIERDGNYVLAYGHNDSQCRTITLRPEDLRLTAVAGSG